MAKNTGSGNTEISAAGFIFCGILALLVAAGLWYTGERGLSFIPAGIALILFLAARQKKEENNKKEMELKAQTGIEVPEIKTVQKLDKYPDRMDGQPLKYYYIMDFVPLPGVNIADIIGGFEKIVDVKSNGENIELSYNNQPFGTIEQADKAKMLADYEKRGNCANAVLLASGQVNLRFYRDPRIGNEWREQEVVKLTAYKSRKKQEAIEFEEPGNQVELIDDEQTENAVNVEGADGILGRLPAKIAKRYLKEGVYGVWIEKIDDEETENGDIIYAPTVRIYW